MSGVTNYKYPILVSKNKKIKNLKNGEKFVARNPHLYIHL